MNCHRCLEDHIEVEVVPTEDAQGRPRRVLRLIGGYGCPDLVRGATARWRAFRAAQVVLPDQEEN